MRRLTHERVHILRTANLPDRHFERLWRVSAQTVYFARTGKTWRDHTTPPDDSPRVNKGNWGDLTDTSTPEHP